MFDLTQRDGAAVASDFNATPNYARPKQIESSNLLLGDNLTAMFPCARARELRHGPKNVLCVDCATV